MSDKIELKPCPFCGGNDLNDDGHFVECFDCHATGPSHYPIPQGAAESWNRRHEATEPKDCGFTLATCPYERCSGRTMRNPKADEPLALLADRKGTGLWILPPDEMNTHWMIRLADRTMSFMAPTYPACEAKARAFLSGLPDREGN